jgi:glucosamine--fructose-6-phosphate aminotransferase (isomerizing)
MQVLIHTGPEIGVASTKAFTTQITVLTMIALRLKKARNVVTPDFHMYLQELDLTEKVKEALETSDLTKEIAATFKDAPNCLYLGRGYNSQ